MSGNSACFTKKRLLLTYSTQITKILVSESSMTNRLVLFDNVSVCQGRNIERCVTYECACMSRFHYVDPRWLVCSFHCEICCSVVVEANKNVLHCIL